MSNYLDWVPKRQYKGFRALSVSLSLLSLLLSLSIYLPSPSICLGTHAKSTSPYVFACETLGPSPQKIRTRHDPQKIGLAFELSLSANAWFVPGRDPRCTHAKSRLLCIFASETAVTSPSPVCYQTRPHRLCLKRFPTVYYQTHPAALRSVWENEKRPKSVPDATPPSPRPRSVWERKRTRAPCFGRRFAGSSVRPPLPVPPPLSVYFVSFGGKKKLIGSVDLWASKLSLRVPCSQCASCCAG